MEKFHSVTGSYYKDTDGFILVFDLAQPSTFNNLNDQLDKILELSPLQS